MVLSGPVGWRQFGTRYVAPPPVMIVERNRFLRRRKHDRTGDEVFLGCAGKLGRGGSALGDGHVARGLDERRELVVGHFVLIHPEAVDIYAMNWPGVGHGVMAAVR